MGSIVEYFKIRVEKYGKNPIVWEKQYEEYESTSYQEALSLVESYAAGLLELGLEKGDRVSLLSEGRKDWLLSELAILFVGAINVPLSVKLEEDNDLVFRISHSDSRFVIVSEFQLDKIRKIKKDLPILEKVIVLDDIESLEDDEILWSDLKSKGAEILKKDENFVEKISSTVLASDIANISYTSGTTADPKGIMLSHRNYTANVEQAFSYIDIPEYYTTLVVLPWDHAFAHTAALYAFMYRGASIASVKAGKTANETLRNFPINMQEVKPYVMMSVPALAKNFRNNIERGVQKKGELAWKLFQFAIKYSYWYNGTGDNKGKGLKKITRPLGILFDKILFKNVREAFGGNLQFFIGGGALLDIELQKLFYAIGIPMYQGYGLSEAAPIISANTPAYHKMGSSGKVVNDLEIKIVDSDNNEVESGVSGEIVIKGENVMLGYWKNPEATAETIIEDWLYTGDLGYLDDENYLYVLGRFKSLLIASDGEKYSPEGIEEAIVDNSTLIEQCMLYNNQSPSTTSVIVPSVEGINRLISKEEFETEDEKIEFVLSEIQNEINQFKKGGRLETLFPHRWLPSSVVIAGEPFTENNRMLNSTMKMVRRVIEEYYAKEIEQSFTSDGRRIDNENNKEMIKKLLKL